MSTLSVCLIVKNEENFIQKSLESIKDISDEIIVVDTGSKDKTIEIAKIYTNKIFHYKWNKNFSDAKNFGIDKAKSDFILILDGDEIFNTKGQQEIINCLQDKEAAAFNISVINYSNENIVLSRFKIERLFRNLGIKYRRYMHETIDKSLEKVIRDKSLYLKDTTLEIFHYGYEYNEVKIIEKSKRNIEILELALENKNISLEDQIFYKINMGYELINLRELQKARLYLLHAFEIIQRENLENEYYKYLYLSLVRTYFEENDLKNAEKFCKLGLKIYPEFINLLYILGNIYNLNGNFKESIFICNKTIEIIINNKEFSSIGLIDFCYLLVDNYQKTKNKIQLKNILDYINKIKNSNS